MSKSHEIQVTTDRDSVCAGDDRESHAAVFLISPFANVSDLLSTAWQVSPLAGIAGGLATWLIDVGSSKKCIGVMAEQWEQPKLLIPLHTTAGDLFAGTETSLYFRYWCQSDPDAVLAAIQSNEQLPSKSSH